MKLRKIVLVMMAALLFTSAIAGCSSGDTDNTDTNVNTEDTGNEQTDNPDQENNASSDTEQITLRYAAWDMGTEEENNIYRRMVAQFEENHPNIKIELAEDIDSTKWEESLATAAAGGNLPDVVMIASLPNAVANEWALDVTAYTEADEEWDNIPTVLSESGVYNEAVYGLPYGMHLSGIYINVDLFEERNQEVLTYGYTFEEFEEAVENMTAPSEGITALKTYDVIDWYPAVMDSSYGWFTYKDGEVSLNDPLFIEGVKYAQSLINNGSAFSGLTDEQKSTFGVEGDWEAWNAGKIAMTYDPTSSAVGYSELSSEIRFIGLPEGKSVIIPDYVFISNTTEHPDEAFEFVRWMTFSKEGIMAKLDEVESDPDLSWGGLPLNTDEEIVERLFADYPIDGVREVYENMEGNTIVEAFKFTPGYTNARWQALTGISVNDSDNATISEVLDACMRGELNIDDYAEQLNTLSNNAIKEVMDIINSK